MSKDKIKKNLSMSYSDWKMYSDYQYKGIIGQLMKYDHGQLEEDLPNKKYNKILEIGPGPHPHIQYIKHDFDKYYILEKEEKIIKHYKKFKNNTNQIIPVIGANPDDGLKIGVSN